MVSARGVKKLVQAAGQTVRDYCTWWPEGVWGVCCAEHDQTAGSWTTPWLVSNYHLAACVWASSYSPRVDRPWKKHLVRFAGVVMFLGTSTLGWPWRWLALIKTFCTYIKTRLNNP